MSAMEDAANLAAAGQQVQSNISGQGQELVQQLTNVIGATLQQIRILAEESTSVAAAILGEDHPSTANIVGAAANVVAKVEETMGLLSAIELKELELQDTAISLAAAFDDAAMHLRGGT